MKQPHSIPEGAEILTVREAANWLRVHPNTVRKLVKNNHLPAFLMATLPAEARENLFQMLRDMALFKEDKPKYHAPISELLVLHYKLLKEFSDVTRTLAEAMEDGKITQEEFSSYEKERAEFLAIDAQLHARMRRETEWYKDNEFYA